MLIVFSFAIFIEFPADKRDTFSWFLFSLTFPHHRWACKLLFASFCFTCLGSLLSSGPTRINAWNSRMNQSLGIGPPHPQVFGVILTAVTWAAISKMPKLATFVCRALWLIPTPPSPNNWPHTSHQTRSLALKLSIWLLYLRKRPLELTSDLRFPLKPS